MIEEAKKQDTTSPKSQGFEGLGIHPKIMESLAILHFKSPTPIQHKAIPVAIEGKDIIGIAQTGTGKTLAFGIPMVQRLSSLPNKQGLVILPTRELALQVQETLHKVFGKLGLKTAVLIGGTGMGLQIKNLKQNPNIIIATPGRLNDHVASRNLSLQNVAVLVLDEADHMFDMGFAPQIKKILTLLPKERQTLLFSATMPHEILKVATTYMQLPLRFEIAPQGTTAEKVEHELFFVQKEQRMPLLKKILSESQGSILLFSRTKHGATKICRQLVSQNISATEIHSNKSLNQRTSALSGFKSGRYRVLVATDIASRGIDVKGLSMVINYDLPESASDYVHRIGRTGRAGLAGKAISFATHDQRSKVREIERLIRYVIPVSHPTGIVAEPHIPQKKYVHTNYAPPRNKLRRNFHKKY
ncbi:MAG: DEAD/DEAH box helicase [Candidatus Staskawiczbacteria bacterium]|nr:DEAD/DEAH box helicase [Candidatus Staskawiczbacteria bacterium]